MVLLQATEVMMTPNVKLEGYDTWTEFHADFATISSSVHMFGLNVFGHVLFAAMAVSAVIATPQTSCWTLAHV